MMSAPKVASPIIHIFEILDIKNGTIVGMQYNKRPSDCQLDVIFKVYKMGCSTTALEAPLTTNI